MLIGKPYAAVLGLVALVAAGPAASFTFIDGKTATCTARGGNVLEYEAPPDEPLVKGRVAYTALDGDHYLIVWNPERLKALPPDVHDYLFFHECAHARVPTSDEVIANCQGLKEMRAAGRAGPEVEARLAAFYGAASSYWKATLSCANGTAGK